jgi:hypothetical protein
MRRCYIVPAPGPSAPTHADCVGSEDQTRRHEMVALANRTCVSSSALIGCTKAPRTKHRVS